MAIPKRFDKEILGKDRLAVGDSVVILDEFISPAEINPKFMGFLMGMVKLQDGTEGFLGLNKTSYDAIAEVYGKDTVAWIGKAIKFDGLKQMGNMTGRSFSAVI